MSCPSCRGRERRQIAPGYWECQTLIGTLVAGPGSVGRPGPQALPVSRPCLNRYQEGPASTHQSLCACGTFAIGVCGDCRRSVCGDCSQVQSGSRTCTSCVTERDHSERQAGLDASALAAGKASAVLDAFVQAMGEAGDPGSVEVWPVPEGFDLGLSTAEQRRFEKLWKKEGRKTWPARHHTSSDLLRGFHLQKLQSAGVAARGWVVGVTVATASGTSTAITPDSSYRVTRNLLLLKTGNFAECENPLLPVASYLPPRRDVDVIEIATTVRRLAAEHGVVLPR